MVLLALPVPGFLWFGTRMYGSTGTWAAGLAAGVCLMGAVLAFGVSRSFVGPRSANGFLLGMLFRMGLPLGVTLGALTIQSPLFDAGFLGMLVAYYLIALAIETVFAVRTLDVGQTLRKVA